MGSKEQSERPRRKGLVIVNTGAGKGKTTAALGLLLRAWGRGLRVCMIQFVKHEQGNWGEVRAARKMEGVDWIKVGDGFTWTSDDIEETAALAVRGWSLAQEQIAEGDYDLVILDEFTYPLHFGWLDVVQVLDWLAENKPESMHLVITGRDAPVELIDWAHLVTEMRKVKHPYDQGQKAQAGIDF